MYVSKEFKLHSNIKISNNILGLFPSFYKEVRVSITPKNQQYPRQLLHNIYGSTIVLICQY